jgi:hypothetical protein
MFVKRKKLMKTSFKQITQACLILIYTFILSGCTKESNNNSNNNSGTYSFEYTVDGEKYSWSGYPSNNQCIYLESGPYSSASMLPSTNNGISISSESTWQLGSIVFDNKSGFTEGFGLIGSNGGTSKATGGSVTLNVTEKGSGRNSHVKGNFSGKVINMNTQKPMTISGTFDLCNITP